MKKEIIFSLTVLLSSVFFSQNNIYSPADSVMTRNKSLTREHVVDVDFSLSKPITEKSVLGAANKTNAITWTNFSNSENIFGVLISSSKPLQYNDELNTVSFIQRRSKFYNASPTPATNAASGVIVAMISSNWGNSWDSTCIWSNNTNLGRYPQGGIYNPPGNTNISNAYVVGCGPTFASSSSAWNGNWYASKQIGIGNYNNVASATVNAQQFFSSLAPSPGMGECFFSRNSFSSTDDGAVRSLAQIVSGLGVNTFPTIDNRGAMVVKGVFNSGVFSWLGDSLISTASYANFGLNKSVDSESYMAWNEGGTIGYVVFIGSRLGATASNKGWQPIVYKTTNSGATWALMPAIDFNSSAAAPIKSHLPAINNSNLPNATVVPFFKRSEGIDVIVDKNNKLHIACVITGAASAHIDSIQNVYTYTNEHYLWKHTPGKHPYLYDFVGDGTSAWSYGIVDSLSSEAAGAISGNPGYNDNPWDADMSNNGNKAECSSRIQLSRTPDGRYVLFTWAETDTNFSNQGRAWNSLPNVKVRLLDANSYSLSPSKIDLTSGSPGVSARATMHFASPKSSSATVTSSINIKLPLTVTNSLPYYQVNSNTHWFSAADLSFSQAMIPFTHTIGTIETVGVGLQERNSRNFLMTVFPQPANEMVSIVGDEFKNGEVVEIEIVNSLGITVWQENCFVSNKTITIYTDDLRDGVYLLKLKIQSLEVISKKIIIAR